MRAEFPKVAKKWINTKTEEEMGFVQKVIESVRNIRGENNVSPATEIKVQVRASGKKQKAAFEHYDEYVRKLARVGKVELVSSKFKPKFSSSSVVDGSEIFVPLEGIIDLDAERTRLEKEIDRLQQLLEAIEKKLANPQFVERAPKDVVLYEKTKLENFKANLEKLKKNLQLIHF
mgnify:FL=1